MPGVQLAGGGHDGCEDRVRVDTRHIAVIASTPGQLGPLRELLLLGMLWASAAIGTGRENDERSQAEGEPG